jgi:hypothetical protein
MYIIITAFDFQVNLTHKYMTMPRLSLYRPNRTNDYQFLDRTISEMYTVGGLDLYVHKYLGPKTGDAGDADATLPVYDQQNPLFVEDLLLGETRDRVYDPDIFIMRGVYRVQDIDFDLTQFGLFLNNDTMFITFHYNDMIDTFGRKLMSGDVLEFPNLKDYNPLDTSLVKALPRYYVIQDAAFASEGFSVTWLPHLWRVKATPLVNAQEYQDIMNQPFMPENIWDPGNFYPNTTIVKDGDTYYQANGNVPAGTPIDAVNPSTGLPYWTLITNPNTLGDKNSTRPKDLVINDAILTQAYAEVPLSGYDTVKFYILPTGPNGEPASAGLTADDTDPTVDGTEPGEGISPKGFGYTMGYLTGSKNPETGYLIPPNGLPVTPGVNFPANPVLGDYALRLDYFPNRLFRYDGARWVKIEEDVRTDLNLANPGALSQRASFVNNTYTVPTTDMGNIPSRQSLSEILKPLADNGDQGGNLPPNPRPPGR